MARRNYYKTQYNRPNRKWVCGRARAGQPCPKGPTTGGNCPGRYECTPVKIEGRWHCTRPDPYGGPCDSPALAHPDFGPMSSPSGESAVCCRPAGCIPERSLRSKRNLVAYAAVGLCLGIILAGIGSPRVRDRFITPGLLTVHHQGASVGAGRLAGTDELNCAQCHHALADDEQDGGALWAAARPFGWMRAAFDGPPESTPEERLQQNALCLDCHQSNWVATPNSPHGLEPDVLKAYTERTAGSEPVQAGGPLLLLAKWTGGPPMTEQEELACATCHREHQGRLHDLKVLNDRQCQVCHVQQFSSFNSGHPEFPSREDGDDYTYPYRRRERIIYDHVYHEKQQFTQPQLDAEGSPVLDENGNPQRVRVPGAPPAGQEGCMSCHTLDHSERTMQIKSFEAMCSDCHFEKNILGAKPIRVLGYAGLTGGVRFSIDDLEFVLEDEIDAAEEPDKPALENILDDFIDIKDRLTLMPVANQSEVSPFMLPLIRNYYDGTDEQFVADMRLIFDRMDGDLKNIDDSDLSAIPEQVAAIERFSMASQRAEAEFVAGRYAPEGEEAGSPVFKPWTEPLGLTVAQRNAAFGPLGKQEAWLASELDTVGGENLVSSGGWEVVPETPETPWADELAELEPLNNLLAAQPQPAEGEAPEEGEAAAAAPIAEIDAVANWLRDPAGFGAWLLQNVQLVGRQWRMPNDAEAPLTAETWATALTDVPQVAALEAKLADPELPEETATAIFDFLAWLKEPEEVRQSLGILSTAPWYGLHEPRNVFYHVTRHADPFLTAWFDATGKLYGDNSQAGALARLVFDRLAGKDAPKLNSAGTCLKCHSVDLRDQGESIAAVVNWSGERERRQFTSFNHAPHLKLQLMTCNNCHAMVEDEDPEFPFADSYLAKFTDAHGAEASQLGTDPTRFRSNFVGLDKKDCTICHTAQDAGNTCLVCHKYHVEDVYRRGVGESLDNLWANLMPATPSEVAAVREELSDAPAPAEPEETADPAPDETDPAPAELAEDPAV